MATVEKPEPEPETEVEVPDKITDVDDVSAILLSIWASCDEIETHLDEEQYDEAIVLLEEYKSKLDQIIEWIEQKGES